MGRRKVMEVRGGKKSKRKKNRKRSRLKGEKISETSDHTHTLKYTPRSSHLLTGEKISTITSIARPLHTCN